MTSLALSLALAVAAVPYVVVKPTSVGLAPGKARVLESRWSTSFDGVPACAALRRVPLAPDQLAASEACRGEASCLGDLAAKAGADFIAAVEVAAIGLGEDGPYTVSAAVVDATTGELPLTLTQRAAGSEQLLAVFRFAATRSCRAMAEARGAAGPPTAAAEPVPELDLDLAMLPDLADFPDDPPAAPPPIAAPPPAPPPAVAELELPDLADIPLEPLPDVAEAPPAAVEPPVVVEPVIVATTPTPAPVVPPAALAPGTEPTVTVPAWAFWVASGVALASTAAGAGLGAATLSAAGARDAAAGPAAWRDAQGDAERMAGFTNLAWGVAAASAASAAGLWWWTEQGAASD